MPEWLIERGIGEVRAALVENGEILEARIELEGAISAGSVLKARLVDQGANNRNAIAVGENGVEFLLPGGSRGVSEGASVTIEVTRGAIPGSEPWKRPSARLTSKAPRSVGSFADTEGRLLVTPTPRDELAAAGWNDLVEEARSGVVRFAGGELRLSATPAMTLIDVDGYLEPQKLALAGSEAAARAVRRLDIGGSIGVDLPTTGGKDARLAAAEVIDRTLPQPFERTAVNGFGFVQIIRPRMRASILELASDRALFETRILLRRVSFERPGSKTIVAHPAVINAIGSRPAWLETLSRQLGGILDLRADEALPMSGGYAEPA